MITHSTLVRSTAALLVAFAASGCNQPPAPSVPSTKPVAKATNTAKKATKSFQLKFTDKAGKEKTADPASLVVVRVNGAKVDTKVSGSRTLLSVDATDEALVELELKDGGKVAFRNGDITGTEAKGSTIWLMPWSDKKFLGQPGPDTAPMTALKGRATIVPLGLALTDAELRRVYIGSYRLPRHLCSADGKNLLMDQSFVFYLAAAKASGDAVPLLRLLVDQGGLQAITVKVNAWKDAIPTGDEPPTMREETFTVAAQDVNGQPTTEAVTDAERFEADVVKVVEGFFPTL